MSESDPRTSIFARELRAGMTVHRHAGPVKVHKTLEITHSGRTRVRVWFTDPEPVVIPNTGPTVAQDTFVHDYKAGDLVRVELSDVL